MPFCVPRRMVLFASAIVILGVLVWSRTAPKIATAVSAAPIPTKTLIPQPAAIATSLPTAIHLPTTTPPLKPTPIPTKTATLAPTVTRMPAKTPFPIIVAQSPRVVIATRPTKINQIIGDLDKERNQPTLSQTSSRYQLVATDLGVPFQHKDRTFVLFGDTIGAHGGDRDSIGYATNPNLENGLKLDFIHDESGLYRPLTIPGISQGAFEVPVEGVSIDGRMYVYHTTDATQSGGPNMGRSVLAVSNDDGQTFRYLYDVSRQSLINISIVRINAADWAGLPQNQGATMMMFGSGKYRKSSVYLAFQPEAGIESRGTLRYFAGLASEGQPIWSDSEQTAIPLFNQSCVGEFSVSYNAFIKKWIMLYNCDSPRGINMRTADRPWGPWTEPQVLFNPWKDNGYCRFMHTAWTFQKCDQIHESDQENTWGGEYGPYQYKELATGTDASTTIYFNMSTWNPYTVVLMKASLRIEPDQ